LVVESWLEKIVTRLLDPLAKSTPALWIEVSPPRGVAYESLLKRLSELKGHVDAINLTDNALAKVKMSALVFGSIIKTRLQIPVVINFSCRDRNLLALKADLLGAAALGIDAVVALTGDKIEPGVHDEARTVRDVDAFGLLRVVSELNRGETGEGKRSLKTLPNLLAGAVANPNREAIDREFELLERKAKGGARFVITQPVFELETARAFANRARSCGIEVVMGVLPIKREGMASYLKKNVKDLSEASHHLERYTGKSEAQVRQESIKDNLALMNELAGEVAGFNIMSGGGPSLAIELALEYSKQRRSLSNESGEKSPGGSNASGA
jgi:5,10-methylenetetrahydrofolate reductase